jgi:hypothetical protein
MGWLGPPKGIFRLHDSDKYCGSLISRPDAAEIFEIPTAALNGLPGTELEGEMHYDEVLLQQAWSTGRIPSPHKARVGAATRSLDELILQRLLELTFNGARITPQVPFGRRSVDLDISVGDNRLLIEFLGPSHFIAQYGTAKPGPRQRKLSVEEFFRAECVLWPYWIQRCQLNALALFSPSVEGLASVWSTKAFFGQFAANDAGDLIEQLTNRFRATSADGIGYMYTDDRVNKPVHPVVASIQAGRVPLDRLIPHGTTRPTRFWVPKQLWEHIEIVRKAS